MCNGESVERFWPHQTAVKLYQVKVDRQYSAYPVSCLA